VAEGKPLALRWVISGGSLIHRRSRGVASGTCFCEGGLAANRAMSFCELARFFLTLRLTEIMSVPAVKERFLDRQESSPSTLSGLRDASFGGSRKPIVGVGGL
jgi:hypothetical protein